MVASHCGGAALPAAAAASARRSAAAATARWPAPRRPGTPAPADRGAHPAGWWPCPPPAPHRWRRAPRHRCGRCAQRRPARWRCAGPARQHAAVGGASPAASQGFEDRRSGRRESPQADADTRAASQDSSAGGAAPGAARCAAGRPCGVRRRCARSPGEVEPHEARDRPGGARRRRRRRGIQQGVGARQVHAAMGAGHHVVAGTGHVRS
jgi:hypothetical protein